MDNLNDAQKQAIVHKDGPMMVLAGPGSGKTTVITKRTKYLVEKHGVNPRNILVITFTKAAAREMKERFEQLMKGECQVTFGTFHSVFFYILKQAYHFTAANIIREETKKAYIKESIDRLNLEVEDEADFISNIIGEISLVKSEMLPIEHYYSTNCAEEIFIQIYKEYDQRLRRNQLIDFDDMLVYCYELLSQRSDILAMWQNYYQYILIDEFQDINKLQYEIVKLLAKPRNNLFIVGDDDQSIYRFRGAKPEIMLGFPKDYENTKTVLLDVNYRSSKDIVDGALRVISNNKNRFEKVIKSNRALEQPIVVKSFSDTNEEYKYLIEEIQKNNRSGMLYQDMAVIFRTNLQPRVLIERLMEYNIPFKMKDMVPNIYEHWIAKDLISYIKIALGDRSRSEFLRVMNRPKRYLSRDLLSSSVVDFSLLKEKVKDKSWMVERIVQLEADLDMVKNLPPFGAIQYIRKAIGYEGYLEEYASFRRMQVSELLEILDQLQDGAREYQTFSQWFAHMEEYKVQLEEQMKQREDKNYDGVTLTTMHSSKGLEYQAVFMIDVNEGITPYKKAVKDADLEEERRMFYVGMTRAKKILHIYWVKEMFHKKMSPSRYIGELSFAKERLKVGNEIYHKKYKKGTITYIDEKKMMVYFEQLKDTRTLSIEYAVSQGLIEF
ncbi:MAG: ATP-dependent helicase [Lachnospiraceae bacterium]|nr:ATP-dependent helicase [Lachnospiraceae bacterium]